MYELTYIINPNLSEEEVAVQTDKVRGFINKLGGEIKTEKLSEKRKLAYPIKKQRFGFYVTTEFKTEPENLPELEKQIKLESSVLRYLLVAKDESETKTRSTRSLKQRKKPFSITKTISETKSEKAKIEEIDKKLEEILEE